MGSATEGMQTSQTGSGAKFMLAYQTTRQGLPWLALDDYSETEPEDLYSRGDRADPQKSSCERTVGDTVNGVRHLAHPHCPDRRDQLLQRKVNCRHQIPPLQ